MDVSIFPTVEILPHFVCALEHVGHKGHSQDISIILHSLRSETLSPLVQVILLEKSEGEPESLLAAPTKMFLLTKLGISFVNTYVHSKRQATM